MSSSSDSFGHRGFGQGALSGLLAKYTELPRVESVYYRDQRVDITGYHFVSCRFDKCHLSIASSNFKLERCVVDDATSFYFEADPSKIIRVVNIRWKWLTTMAPTLSATWHDDGTFSIL